MKRKEIVNKLWLFDDALIEVGHPIIKIYLLGGSALVFKEVIERATNDIDVLLYENAKLQQLMKNYDINDEISEFYKIDGIEENFQEELMKFEKIRLFIPSKELMLAIKVITLATPTIERTEILHVDKEDVVRIIRSGVNKDLTLRCLDDLCNSASSNFSKKLNAQRDGIKYDIGVMIDGYK